MRALVQRVSEASVKVNGQIIARIGQGLLVFLGIGKSDDNVELQYMVKKIVGMRIFEDAQQKMNLALREVQGEMLVVSQFTLYGDTRKGRRPSFFQAMPPEQAEPMIHRFVQKVRDRGIRVQTGEFGAHMEVSLINDGPVTLWIQSPRDLL